MDLHSIIIRPVQIAEEAHFKELMQRYHYLGALPKISNTLWYIATLDNDWLALITFSAAALKCGVRDHWIGRDFRHQFDRLNLIANNSRFLILPQCHYTNLASKILSSCRRRIQRDWIEYFGYPLLLLETFVDPSKFNGTIYRASNWLFIGQTKGYRRVRNGYSAQSEIPKLVFIQPLQRNARDILARPVLPPQYRTGVSKMKLSADQMRSLPDFFKQPLHCR